MEGMIDMNSMFNIQRFAARTYSGGDTIDIAAKYPIEVVSGSVVIDDDGTVTVSGGTVLTMSGYTVTVNGDAGGRLEVEGESISYTPNLNDGTITLTKDGRSSTLSLSGTVTIDADSNISLSDGTVAAFTFQDGSLLNLTSRGSTGSVAFGEQGVKITGSDDNLDLELRTAKGYTMKVTGLKGSLWYNAGKVTIDEGTGLTGTGELGDSAVNISLEAIGGDGYLDFSGEANIVYGAGSGTLKVTYAVGEIASTFIVNKGSVLLGNDAFKITEGTDLATDLQDFMPAMTFTTEAAGTYTINGQTITTTAEGLALTATDDYMAFQTSSDVVEYDGMTFAGAGRVSLSPASVVLGAGVAAAGFGAGNSFVLAEAGDVTADARIFELSKIEDSPREIPMIITVTGAEDGFIFSRTLTKESEAYLDDALDDASFANYTSPYIDKVFTEKFISAGDSSYRIRTDAIGLQEVIGISDGATVTGGAILDNDPTLSYYNLITDSQGSFTIGERTYLITGDSSVAIRARFEPDSAPYASYFDSLSGTVSGNFTNHHLTINSYPLGLVTGDTDISISAAASNLSISGFGTAASLQVASAGTYTINNATITAQAGDLITNTGNNLHIAANSLAAAISNTIPATLITATDAADTITNLNAPMATINAQAGDDLIIVINSSGVLVNSGTGNDVVTTVLDYSTLTGTTDYTDLTVMGGAGNDTIVNWGGTNPSIDGGADNDYIVNRHGYYAAIDAGAGDDMVNISNGH